MTSQREMVQASLLADEGREHRHDVYARRGHERPPLLAATVESALGGQGSGDTRSVASPRESGSVEEVRATEHPAPTRPPVPRVIPNTRRVA